MAVLGLDRLESCPAARADSKVAVSVPGACAAPASPLDAERAVRWPLGSHQPGRRPVRGRKSVGGFELYGHG